MNLNPRFLDPYSIDYDYETILKNICNSSLYFWMNLGILHFVKQRTITLTQFEGHPKIPTVQQNACSEGNSKITQICSLENGVLLCVVRLY